jgi:hypothetical protein
MHPLGDYVDVLTNWRNKRQRRDVPSIEELSDLVETPLSNSEKILISEDWYEALISEDSGNLCTRDDIGTLFTIGDSTQPAVSRCFMAALTPAPDGSTEPTFIHFWDDNIRKVIEALIPEGQSIRDSNHSMETTDCRPDFAFLLNMVCPFRGEEKGPGSTQDAKAQLRDKIIWVYDPAPYMLGKCSTFNYRS